MRVPILCPDDCHKGLPGKVLILVENNSSDWWSVSLINELRVWGPVDTLGFFDPPFASQAAYEGSIPSTRSNDSNNLADF